jgi:hypothetical protein
MSFETYENTWNRHVTIHATGCRQLRKRGGEHVHDQGRYRTHAAYEDAEAYVQSTNLPVIHCSFCHPEVVR